MTMTKIDASRFIADMIKVHGGECPKVWQDALAMQGLTVINGKIVAIKPNAVADGKPAIVDENGLHVLKQDALTEFEQMLKSGTNIYVEQGRRMEDWDAKADAKDLLEIARIQDEVSGIILDREEGEKIRKALVELVHDTTGDSLWVDYDVHKEDAITWLEEQGKTFTKKDIDDAYLKGVCDAKRELEKQGEQKPAWSEEDKCMLNNIIDTLKPLRQTNHSSYAINSMIDWLKSLRPQSTWKPSDEQMVALQEAMNIVGILTITGSKINSLYQDLKKL